MALPSFIDIVDAISPMVTLGFGIYCAVNDTKPKDGKLSKSGKVALWGLIVSGLITMLVKFGELNSKYEAAVEQGRLKDSLAIAQQKELRRKDSTDSINTVFQKATSDSFSKSIRELNNLRSASITTLHSLDAVNEKQQVSLQHTRRGLHPLFPLKVKVEYEIDLKEFFNKNQSLNHFKNEFNQYIDTLVQYASLPRIREDRYKRPGRNDTTYVPKAGQVNPFVVSLPFSNQLPQNFQYRYKDIRNHLRHYFITLGFSIHFREKNEKEAIQNSQIALSFNLQQLMPKIALGEAGEFVKSTIDVNEKRLHVQLLLDNPEVTSSGFKDGFISLYDLQNSIIGLKIGNNETNDVRILKLHKITFYNGYNFLRETSFLFSQSDIKVRCCGELYARRIRPEEIK